MAERSPWLLRWGFLGAAAALVAGGVMLRQTAPEPEARSATGVQPLRVDTVTVSVEPLRVRVQRSGVLEARRRVELFSETDGRVLAVGADELDHVKKGTMLVRVDPTLAKISLERADAAVARSESELELARLNLERRQSLARLEVASAADLDAAENAERIAVARLREARAQLDEARDALAKKTLSAPFSGVLRSFPVEIGEYVRPGELVGELLDLSSVRVSVGVSDREIVAARAGSEAEIEAEARPGESFAGRILRVGAAADVDNMKFPVEVEVANPDARLLPGMVVRVGFDLGEAEPAMLLPRDTTLDDFGRRFVLRVESDGHDGWLARRRPVEVRELPFRPGYYQVVQGLAAGDEVVASELRQLRDGAPVVRRNAAAR